MKMLSSLFFFFCFATFGFAEQSLTLASTTSTQNSGLYEFLLPKFKEQTGITVNVVAVGTGQAIKIAQNGDADALLVHHRPSEDAFVNEGYGFDRRDVMYNDFVLIGPKHDPAKVSDARTVKDALSSIKETQSLFISRGDDSGTHKKEVELWNAFSTVPTDQWYREIGAGMGAALNMAAATDAYLLSDRGTWLSFGNPQNLTLLFEGEAGLRNPYGLILVSKERHPHVKTDEARAFSDWITSPQGQKAIADFRVENKQLFCPNAQPDDDALVFCPSKSTD